MSLKITRSIIVGAVLPGKWVASEPEKLKPRWSIVEQNRQSWKYRLYTYCKLHEAQVGGLH